MKSYVWLTFAFMGWGYYEMSGGSDFVPEERAVAQAQAEAPEIVTRAETPTLLSVSASNATPQPSDDDVTVALLEAVALDTSELAAQAVEPATPQAEVTQIATPATPIEIDLRAVAGSRVNMRSGPGTTFDVITTLDSGTQLEVLSVNAEGWANVSTVDRGVQGWMAERLLTEPET